MNLIEFY